jgi:hypothetical protein
LLWSGVSKVQMIEQIEHLHPELGVDTLRNGSGLEQRDRRLQSPARSCCYECSYRRFQMPGWQMRPG